MAEAYAPSNAVEHGMRTRAPIVDMRGQLNIRPWEETASAMGHFWFADCASLIWDNRDDCDEGVDASKGDYPRWMDTSATLSDCWTKTMTSCRLIETLSAGIFDMRPTEESPAIKAENRTWRASKKEQERLQDLDD